MTVFTATIYTPLRENAFATVSLISTRVQPHLSTPRGGFFLMKLWAPAPAASLGPGLLIFERGEHQSLATILQLIKSY